MSEPNMQAKIHAHIDGLFSGVPAGERVSEVKLELYMNTVDRYEDLLAFGKSPAEAYQEAIDGIGDISEILTSLGVMPSKQSKQAKKEKSRRKVIREHLDSILWMVMLSTYFIVSFATMKWQFTWLIFLITVALQNAFHALFDIINGNRPDCTFVFTREEKRMHRRLSSMLWLAVLVLYFGISFLSGAWYISWIIFLLGTAMQNALSIILVMKKTKDVTK